MNSAQDVLSVCESPTAATMAEQITIREMCVRMISL
jgi:hypothetical protein